MVTFIGRGRGRGVEWRGCRREGEGEEDDRRKIREGEVSEDEKKS